MNPLMKTLIRLDAEYFNKMGYIGDEDMQAVTDWLNGQRNTNININPAAAAAQWLRLDADYFDGCQKDVLRHFWYLAPAILIGFWIIKRLYRRTANRLE